jgi:hypothetical protein
MIQPSYRCRPCESYHNCYNHGSTITSTSAMWINRAPLQPRLDRLINVDRVDPYTTTARPPHQRRSCGSVLQPLIDRFINVDRWIHITTMARPPHQSRPCGSYRILHNHGNDTTSFMWVSQASSLPWLDRFIKVSYVETTLFITTMVATSMLSMRNKSEHLQTHRLTVSSMSVVHNLDPC